MKKLTVLFIIAICMLTLVLGCQKQTTPKTSSNLPATASTLTGKTYSNSQYGFSIQYPADWPPKEGASGTIVIFAGPAVTATGGIININITSEKLPDSPKMSVSDYAKAGETQLQNAFANYAKASESNATIGGQPAVVRVFTGSINNISLKFAQAYLIKGNLSYIITYTSTPDMFDKYSDFFNLAITSFKFN
jgi:hypothetical protein